MIQMGRPLLLGATFAPLLMLVAMADSAPKNQMSRPSEYAVADNQTGSDPVVRSSELRDVLNRYDSERDRRYTESFDSIRHAMEAGFTSQAVAVQAAFAAQEKAIAAAFAAQEKATAAALAAAKEAVAKAESASDKRFESVNEFRGQLKDQQSTFIARGEYISDRATVVARLDAMDGMEAKIVGGLILMAAILPLFSGLIVFFMARKKIEGGLPRP